MYSMYFTSKPYMYGVSINYTLPAAHSPEGLRTGGEGLLRAGPVWGVSIMIPGSTLISMGSIVSPFPLLDKAEGGCMFESCGVTDTGSNRLISFTMSSCFISDMGVAGMGTEGISLTEGGWVDPPPETAKDENDNKGLGTAGFFKRWYM